MFMDMCIDMCVGMRTYMHVDMCIDTSTECKGLPAASEKKKKGQVYIMDPHARIGG